MSKIYKNNKNAEKGTGKLNLSERIMEKAQISFEDEVEVYVNSRKEIVIRKVSK